MEYSLTYMISRLYLGILSLPLFLLLPACGESDGSGEGDTEDTEAGESGEGDGEAGTADEDEGGTAGEDEGDDEDGEGEEAGASEDAYARGIQIERVEFNQGAAIFLGSDSEEIPVESRNGHVIADRRGMVRVQWSLEDEASWEAREIEAVLNLQQPDGSSKEYSHTLEIDGPPILNNYDGTFRWVFKRELVQPGTKIDVALYEKDSNYDSLPLSDTLPRFPRRAAAIWASKRSTCG